MARTRATRSLAAGGSSGAGGSGASERKRARREEARSPASDDETLDCEELALVRNVERTSEELTRIDAAVKEAERALKEAEVAKREQEQAHSVATGKLAAFGGRKQTDSRGRTPRSWTASPRSYGGRLRRITSMRDIFLPMRAPAGSSVGSRRSCQRGKRERGGRSSRRT